MKNKYFIPLLLIFSLFFMWLSAVSVAYNDQAVDENL